MKGHGAKFPRKRQEAIAALLEFPTVREAARAIGIGEATLFRWMQDPEFQTGYREAKRRIVDEAVTRLQRSAGDASGTLRKIMLDDEAPASVRVSAARVILDMAVRAVELEDLERRLTTLEDKMEDMG